MLARIVENPTFHELRPPVEQPDILDLLRESVDLPPDVRVVASEVCDPRGVMTLDSITGGHVELQFAEGPVELSLERWLEQWIINPDITIADLIERVADEEVAHTQNEIGDTVARTQRFLLVGNDQERAMRHAVIVGIGEYVAKRIREIAGIGGSAKPSVHIGRQETGLEEAP